MKRLQSRRSNGRWQRNTLANTFGLSVEVCPTCRIFNPYAVGQPKPVTCHDCGAALGEREGE